MIAGLQVSPPENTIVFSCDEKSRIQALEKTQPGLPMKKGKAAPMTPDYKRNGTTTLFAGLNTLTKAPAPYLWTTSATDSLKKGKRGREKLDKLQTV